MCRDSFSTVYLVIILELVLALFQEYLCKLDQISDLSVVLVRPVKGLLEILVVERIVGKVLGVHTIADHEQLNVPKQTVPCPQ